MSKIQVLALLAFTSLAFGCIGTEPPKKSSSNEATKKDHPSKATTTSKSADEQKLAWAKEVAESFLTACKNGDFTQASLLISPEMKVALGADYQNSISNRALNWQLISWEFKSHTTSPSGKEFRLLYRLRSTGNTATDMTLHVAESGDEAWRVSFMSEGEWREEKTESAEK